MSQYIARVNAFVTLKADIESIRVGDVGRIIALEFDCADIKFAVTTLRDVPVSLLVPPPKVYSGGIGSKVKCTNSQPLIPKGSVGTLIGPSYLRNFVDVAFENGSHTVYEFFLSRIYSHDKPVTDELNGLVRELNIDGKNKKTIEEIRASFGQTKTPTPRNADSFSEQDEISTSLRTEDVTLISHAHGRQRRGYVQQLYIFKNCRVMNLFAAHLIVLCCAVLCCVVFYMEYICEKRNCVNHVTMLMLMLMLMLI